MADNETTARVAAFLDEIEAVCRRHGLSIGHEDHEGAFMVDRFSEQDVRWLRAARVADDLSPPRRMPLPK